MHQSMNPRHEEQREGLNTTVCVRELQLLDVSVRLEAEKLASLGPVDVLYSAPEFRWPLKAAADSTQLNLIVAHPEFSWAEVDGRRQAIAQGPEQFPNTEAWLFARFLDISREFVLVHAGALAHRGKGILLVGPPFAGKTTLSVALAEGGLDYYSDDLAPIHRESGALHPFRRAAAIRRNGHGREYRSLPASSKQNATHVAPEACPIGWVFVLDTPSGRGSEDLEGKWTLILRTGCAEGESELRSLPEVKIARRCESDLGVRFDLEPQQGAGLAGALRRFLTVWSESILYLGPPPMWNRNGFPQEPRIEAISRYEMALLMLRHTLNRSSQSELYRQYGDHPHIKAYSEVLSALSEAKCFKLIPGTPDATTRLVKQIVGADADVNPADDISSPVASALNQKNSRSEK